ALQVLLCPALKKNSTQTHGALGNRQGCVIIIKPI
ncbi:hypothetical protein J551_4191, partial [Acinetobacter sp. 1475718]